MEDPPPKKQGLGNNTATYFMNQIVSPNALQMPVVTNVTYEGGKLTSTKNYETFKFIFAKFQISTPESEGCGAHLATLIFRSPGCKAPEANMAVMSPASWKSLGPAVTQGTPAAFLTAGFMSPDRFVNAPCETKYIRFFRNYFENTDVQNAFTVCRDPVADDSASLPGNPKGSKSRLKHHILINMGIDSKTGKWKLQLPQSQWPHPFVVGW